MKRGYLLLGFFLILLSCDRQNDVERIQNFVIAGYRGFYMVDTAKWQYDSTRFDIREYLEYNNDSSVKISKRMYYKTKFFNITRIDSVRLQSILEMLIRMNIKDTNYYGQEVELYSGLFYTITFSTNWNRHREINYVPHHLPKELKVIHDSLKSIIWMARDTAINSFSYNKLLSRTAIELYKIYPPPPAPDTLSYKVNFTKPIIIKSSKD